MIWQMLLLQNLTVHIYGIVFFLTYLDVSPLYLKQNASDLYGSSHERQQIQAMNTGKSQR